MGGALKAVVPAAGRGVRLSKLTRRHPKPMLKFNGRPLLEHTLRSLREAGVREVVIVVGYKGDEIASYFSDGSWLGLRVEYAVDERISGTATAIKAAEEHVDSAFLMVFGDVYPEPELVRAV
ncbi:MAG: hypothetical protein DRJ56_08555, partial [Thermoprotei archaeon]